MTQKSLMNREELLKLAALDVYGLLDEYETEEFNRSFHEASANVQDEIVALQAAIAADTSLSANNDEPRDELRDKVLARVQDAIEREAEYLAPIPIYARRKARLASQRNMHKRLERSARMWRAAAFVMAASLVILVVQLYQSLEYGKDMYTIAMNQKLQELAEELLPDYSSFINNPNVVVVNLRTDGDSRKHATQLLVNIVTKEVLVLAMGFEPTESERYQLVIRSRDSDEADTKVGAFSSNGTLACAIFTLDEDADLSNVFAINWEIIDTESGQRIAFA